MDSFFSISVSAFQFCFVDFISFSSVWYGFVKVFFIHKFVYIISCYCVFIVIVMWTHATDTAAATYFCNRVGNDSTVETTIAAAADTA